MTKIGCKLKITGSILLFLFIFNSSSLFFFPLANNNISKGESVENSEELKMINEVLGDLPIAGFYANGEVAGNQLYGYTGVLTLFL